MQLGKEDEGFLRWLRVAQPGDRPHCELTLEEVTLDPERVSRSTWKFLVCKGQQMTETVWLTAVRAWLRSGQFKGSKKSWPPQNVP